MLPSRDDFSSKNKTKKMFGVKTFIETFCLQVNTFREIFWNEEKTFSETFCIRDKPFSETFSVREKTLSEKFCLEHKNKMFHEKSYLFQNVSQKVLSCIQNVSLKAFS